jgi:hypothetical protein
MVTAECSYAAVGGSIHPAAADWDSLSGMLAFAADRNVALWDTTVSPSLLGDDRFYSVDTRA